VLVLLFILGAVAPLLAAVITVFAFELLPFSGVSRLLTTTFILFTGVVSSSKFGGASRLLLKGIILAAVAP
jgi:uncharacterized membrane protein YkgB